ncbi:uncharacterized protein LOC143738548 [Siphateles boraxobius]|uniref:uncharacterized protein LOC143738548 n=1 Tax=Siphateles boraxobius TaxID=180520 RepID=UPI004064A504
MYDGARVPSPEDATNGVPLKPETPATTRPKASEEPEEEEGVPEPVLVKKAHREILDHERKRRVELKCMELQEMMEEQGYSEEEIRQKVETFRQMLMEKEGVITREGLHPRPPVRLLPHGDEDHVEDAAYTDGYEQHYEWDGEYYEQNSAYDESRSKRKSSSSPSPRPKKRKKKKARRHSRADSPSPTRRDKRKKSGKKHRKDRSTSGSRRKRRHRSGSPKIKHKDKSKQKKRCSGESPCRSSQHRGSCCSSRSGSVSSTASLSRSPSRSNAKCKNDRHKQEGSHSAHTPPPSPSADQPITWQNGNHSVRVRNGKDSGANHTEANKGNDKLGSLAPSPSSASPHLRGVKHHSGLPKSPAGSAFPTGEDDRPVSESSGRRSGRPRVREKTSRSPAHSSDSHTKNKSQKKSHSSKRHHRGRAQNRHRSSSVSPGRHKHTSKKKKSKSHGTGRQRSSSWSSERSSSRDHSRECVSSKNKSPHTRQNNSRERDSPHHSDAERSRRRSRSYSPIRKRRRDSPSFMEARRITSARKRPIPYYRPSPSSSSSASSFSSSSRSRSRSRSYSSFSSRSRSRSQSPSHSYYSQSSYESPGF